MKDLIIFLKIPPIIYCENISAIALASNPVYHARTKHIEVDYHFTREKVVRGDIQICFVNSIDQLADVFTKGLSSAQFTLLKNKLHATDWPLSLRGAVSQTNHMAHLAYQTFNHDR